MVYKCNTRTPNDSWKKVFYTTLTHEPFVDHYPYNNEQISSCARVRPYLPKSKRPRKDLPVSPRKNSLYHISPKPKSRMSKKSREASDHFAKCVEQVANDAECRPELLLQNSWDKNIAGFKNEVSSAAPEKSKYVSGFGVRPKPRSKKIHLNGLNITGIEKPKLSKLPKPKKSRIVTGASCARVRPIPSTYVCARCRPYSGLRKEFHWYYFMMHPERRTSYLPKKGHQTQPVLDSVRGKSMKSVVCADMPLPLQYRSYLQKATKIFLGKSPIHGIGVFADEDIETGRLVLEYRGQIIRNSLVDMRERTYRRKGLGSYMFVLSSEYTVDATMHGSVARFINHSCEPNCAAKIINYQGSKKIVLYTICSVEKGEELCYNYKLPLEPEKIPCLCKRPSCRKFLN